MSHEIDTGEMMTDDGLPYHDGFYRLIWSRRLVVSELEHVEWVSFNDIPWC